MSPLPVRVRRAAGRVPQLSPVQAAERSLQLRLLSLLLGYPDTELVGARAELTEVVRGLRAGAVRGALQEFVEWFADRPPEELERHYVDLFDLRRKSSLHLTYYLHGDTRRRGAALLAVAQRYRAHGWEPPADELPDHLPVALEFAALAGPRAGEAPLRAHRRGIDLIHQALDDADSPYRHVLAALRTLLPPQSEADRRAVAALVAEGPPVEEVGYAPDAEDEAPDAARLAAAAAGFDPEVPAAFGGPTWR
ncbi:nitrate reductase molybdenum cofactor assembly chaperone [Streptomyces sulphureus]|uniref:nitrate reductase molybdenum cofactor assembly chaperone n=1 Tax=Streptomyces sulphureus TaxID=47758 RepID=UPI0003687168|nr:nitrate reductase molybdenum cofactor assembly chaperone [Streptomyces sulphureus]